MGFSGTPKDMGPPKMVSGTHTTPIRIPKDMGPMVWVPLTIFGGPIIIGGPRSNPIDLVGRIFIPETKPASLPLKKKAAKKGPAKRNGSSSKQ